MKKDWLSVLILLCIFTLLAIHVQEERSSGRKQQPTQAATDPNER